MSTLSADLINAFVDRLEAAPAVSSNIGKDRQRPWPSTVDDAINVRPLGGDIEEGAAVLYGDDTWIVSVGVECTVRVDQGTAPTAAADSLMAAAYARIMGDPTLGGVVTPGVEPAAFSYSNDADGDQTVTATLVFRARMTSGAIFN